MNKGLFLLYLVVALFCASCIPAPTPPEPGSGSITPGGIWVVCEGLWHQNNSTLSYAAPSGNIIRDAMQYVNGKGLGDTPSDAVVIGDTLVIAVNTSRTIVIIEKSTGVLIRTIRMPGDREPYRLATNGKRVWCTNLNDDSISELEVSTGQVTVEAIPVGPAPEGIANVQGKLYVAISGLGDLRANEPGAGTVLVLSDRDLQAVTRVGGTPNVGAITADRKRNVVWCAYRNLPSESSPGGVALIDAVADTVLARWAFTSPTRISIEPESGDAFVLHESGVDRISRISPNPTRIIEHSSSAGSDFWNTLTYDAVSGRLLIGNARSYVTDGQLLMYSITGNQLNQVQVGPNPAVIIP